MNLQRHVRRLTPDERSAAVLAAKAGDREARDRLLADSYPLALKFARRYVTAAHYGRHEIDEITQDLYVSLLQSLERLRLDGVADPGKRFTSVAWWGFRGVKAHFDTKKGRRRWLQYVDFDAVGEPAASQDEVSVTAGRDERRRLVRRMLGRLTGVQAHALTRLYGLDGAMPETARQIARRKGVSHQAVINAHGHALKRLRLLAEIQEQEVA